MKETDPLPGNQRPPDDSYPHEKVVQTPARGFSGKSAVGARIEDPRGAPYAYAAGILEGYERPAFALYNHPNYFAFMMFSISALLNSLLNWL